MHAPAKQSRAAEGPEQGSAGDPTGDATPYQAPQRPASAVQTLPTVIEEAGHDGSMAGTPHMQDASKAAQQINHGSGKDVSRQDDAIHTEAAGADQAHAAGGEVAEAQGPDMQMDIVPPAANSLPQDPAPEADTAPCADQDIPDAAAIVAHDATQRYQDMQGATMEYEAYAEGLAEQLENSHVSSAEEQHVPHLDAEDSAMHGEAEEVHASRGEAMQSHAEEEHAHQTAYITPIASNAEPQPADDRHAERDIPSKPPAPDSPMHGVGDGIVQRDAELLHTAEEPASGILMHANAEHQPAEDSHAEQVHAAELPAHDCLLIHGNADQVRAGGEQPAQTELARHHAEQEHVSKQSAEDSRMHDDAEQALASELAPDPISMHSPADPAGAEATISKAGSQAAAQSAPPGPRMQDDLPVSSPTVRPPAGRDLTAQPQQDQQPEAVMHAGSNDSSTPLQHQAAAARGMRAEQHAAATPSPAMAQKTPMPQQPSGMQAMTGPGPDVDPVTFPRSPVHVYPSLPKEHSGPLQKMPRLHSLAAGSMAPNMLQPKPAPQKQTPRQLCTLPPAVLIHPLPQPVTTKVGPGHALSAAMLQPATALLPLQLAVPVLAPHAQEHQRQRCMPAGSQGTVTAGAGRSHAQFAQQTGVQPTAQPAAAAGRASAAPMMPAALNVPNTMKMPDNMRKLNQQLKHQQDAPLARMSRPSPRNAQLQKDSTVLGANLSRQAAPPQKGSAGAGSSTAPQHTNQQKSSAAGGSVGGRSSAGKVVPGASPSQPFGGAPKQTPSSSMAKQAARTGMPKQAAIGSMPGSSKAPVQQSQKPPAAVVAHRKPPVVAHVPASEDVTMHNAPEPLQVETIFAFFQHGICYVKKPH